MNDLLYLVLGSALFALAGWLVRERPSRPVEVSNTATPPPGGAR